MVKVLWRTSCSNICQLLTGLVLLSLVTGCAIPTATRIPAEFTFMPATNQAPQPNTNNTAPEINSVQVDSVTHYSASISWTTAQPCEGLVLWGTTTDYEFLTQPVGQPALQQWVTLKDLEADTIYHYAVVVTGQNEAQTASQDAIFRTLRRLSTTPPEILYISVSGITGSTARIEWETDKPTSGQVEHGETDLYGCSTVTEGFTYTHSLDLQQLSPGTIYHFRVLARDMDENGATSEDRLFATAEPSDKTAPAISGITITGVTYEGAIIEWETDELATSQVEYGTTLIYSKTTPDDGCYVFEHAVTLNSLDVDRTCHFRIKSVDSSGNVSISDDNVFITLTAPRTAGIVPSRHPRCRCRY